MCAHVSAQVQTSSHTICHSYIGHKHIGHAYAGANVEPLEHTPVRIPPASVRVEDAQSTTEPSMIVGPASAAPPPPCGTTVAEQPSTESDRTDDMVGPAQQGSHAHGRTAGLEGAPAGALQASLSSTTHDLLRFCAISRSTPTANAEVLCRWEGT